MRALRVGTAILAAVLAACAHDSSPVAPEVTPSPPVPASLELLLGGPLSGSGDFLVTVTSRDAAQLFVGGVTVTLTSSSGALDQDTITTSLPLGQAQTWLRHPKADTVTVTARGGNGLMATASAGTAAATVPGADDFSFEVSKAEPAVGEAVYFTVAPSSGGPLSGSVDFGDGDAASASLATGTVTITHRYGRAGTMTATARLHAAGGPTITRSLVLNVTAQAPPAVSLSISPSAPTAADVVTLSAGVSGDRGVGFAWDWTADGTVDLRTTASSTTHLYAAGSYRARVTVALDDGSGATAEAAFLVAPAAAPTVSLSANTVTVGSATVLAASVTHGTPTSYTWAPGDGSAPTTTAWGSLRYIYAAAGTYTATVDVTLIEGGTVRGQTSVVVQSPAPLSVAVSASGSHLAGTPTTLTASVTGGTAVSFAWNFGDGSPVSTVTSASLTHVYAAAGIYAIGVTVTDALGRSAIGATSVSILDPLVVALTATVGSVGNPTSFVVTVTGGTAATADWDFGDGNTLSHGSTTGLSHVYLTTGDYTATITITDTLGRAQTASVNFVVS